MTDDSMTLVADTQPAPVEDKETSNEFAKPSIRERALTEIIVVTSGKGGVGKTTDRKSVV